MRRYYYIIIIAILLIAIASCSREPVHIFGNISALPNGAVYLRAYEGGAMRTMDSTQSVGGRFEIVMPQILPNILYVQFESDPNYYIPVMVEGEDVSIGGNINYYNEITVTGTAANETLGEHRQQVRRHDILLRTVENQLLVMDTTSGNASVQRIELEGKRDSLKRLISDCRHEFVMSHRGSIVSAFLATLTLTESTTLPQIDSLLGELDPTMADNAFMRKLHRRQNAMKR